MSETILIPKKSVGIFNINDRIKNYTYLHHTKEHHIEKYFSYDSYDFNVKGMVLWVENDEIESICCSESCYLNDKNLILMPFDKFLSEYNAIPDSSEKIYLLVNGRGQNQIVYEFETLGLQIWVWRGKIRTVIANNYVEENE